MSRIPASSSAPSAPSSDSASPAAMSLPLLLPRDSGLAGGSPVIPSSAGPAPRAPRPLKDSSRAAPPQNPRRVCCPCAALVRLGSVSCMRHTDITVAPSCTTPAARQGSRKGLVTISSPSPHSGMPAYVWHGRASRPPIRGPRVVPMPQEMLRNTSAWPCELASHDSPIIVFSDPKMPLKKPPTKRARHAISYERENPKSSTDTVAVALPITTTGLRPKRSENLPQKYAVRNIARQ
mmetsp:Transcript_10633/g.26820  ORF Transcript_10633/g.26820 Transcript_10633/m.26820 type:complete len:236 (+) Transcript_10633:898-1605(+)